MNTQKLFFYGRIVMAQVAAFAVSQLLVNVVFLGPVPVVRSEFVHQLEQTPQKVAEGSKQVVTTVSSAVKSLPEKLASIGKGQGDGTGGDGTGGGWPGGGNSPTGNPFERDNPYAPTAAPTAVAANPQNPQNPVRPTNIPVAKPTSGFRLPQIFPTKRPTQPPPLTQPPSQPDPTDTPSSGGGGGGGSTGGGSQSAIEQDTFAGINRERQKLKLSALTINSKLAAAAKKHSQYMKSSGDFNHVTKGGSTPEKRIAAEGYRGGGVGETIAQGFTTGSALVDGWMKSAPHKAILMSPRGREIGIGYEGGFATAMVGY